MAQTAINLARRALTVLLALVAGVLACAIYVAAKSPGRARAEAALAETRGQAEEARNDAAQRIEALEQANAELGKQLELAKADLKRQAEKLAATEQATLKLRGDYDAALKQIAELSQKYADARIKADEAAVAAREAQRKARLAADAALAVKAPPAEIDIVRAGNKNRVQLAQECAGG